MPLPELHGRLRGVASRLTWSYARSVYGAMLIVIVGGLVIPVLVAGYVLLVVQERESTVAELDETLQRNADILSRGMRESLRDRNTDAARSLVDAVMRDPSVVRVQVLGRQRSEKGRAHTSPFIDVHAPARPLGRVVHAMRDVEVRGERIGQVRIEMDDLLRVQALHRKQRNYALVLAVQVLVSLALILAFLRRRLRIPLRRLTGFSDRLSRGDFDTPLVLEAPGELGRLGTQMERMRVAIRDLFADVARREEQFRTIVTQVPGAVFRARPGGAIDFVSDAIAGIARVPAAQFMRGSTGDWANLVVPEDRRLQRKVTREALQSGNSYEVEYRIVDGQGRERWVLESGQPQRVPGEDGFWVDGIISDISERKHNEMRIAALLAEQGADIAERKEAEEKLRLSSTVLEHIADGVMVVDVYGMIVTVNPAFTHITGWSAQEVVGRPWSVTRSNPGSNPGASGHDQDLFWTMWRQLGETGFWRGELWSTRKDGQTWLQWLTVSTVRNGAGKVAHYVGVFSDITRLKQSQEKLDYLAHHDPLTSLPNRLLFHDRLLHAIGRATRESQQLAVMFIDLDRFKNVNDTLGHHVGDELLKQVAALLAARLRDGDTLARLGGDEFVVLLENVSGDFGARQVADKLIGMFEQPFVVASHELYVTGSIGISMFPGDGIDANLLVRNADVAMYQAKSRGRNGYQFYAREMDGEGVVRLRMEALLRRAIERHEIFVHYQPQVDIESGRLIGVEALVRWTNPELGPVSPVRFIPMAEETGFINQIGEWVLLEACRQMVRWDEAGLVVPKVAVNLSVRQVERGAMASQVAHVLAETGLAPQRLQLEVTESVIMDTGDALAFVHELHAMGVGLAIDDFGTGYSSLAYLKQLPVDVLKIDRSFIKDIALDSNDEAIAIAIIQLGKSMNLSVIAEGVETEGQAAFLLRHGCTRAQGYLYGRPVAPGELLQEWGQDERQARLGTIT